MAVFNFKTINYLLGIRSIKPICNIHHKEILNYLINTKKIDILPHYVLQGIAIIKNILLVTAYDCTKKDNSIIYVIKEDNYRIVYLDVNSHVGGIGVDNLHNIVWITEKYGRINGYKLEDILNKKEVNAYYKKVKLGDDFLNPANYNSVAYLTVYDNKLYVGNYNTQDKCILKEFKIKKDGSLDIETTKTFKFLDYVQGITFYKYNNIDYVLVSSSYGSFNKSRLKIIPFKELNNINTYYEIKLRPMLEQIFVDKNKLYTLYENNADRFKYSKKTSEDIIVYNIEDIFKNYIN